MSKEDREEQDKALTAHAESLIRQDLMEYLYLFEAWYRDVLVFQATGDVARVLNRDQAARFERGPVCAPSTLAAIEKAWVYIERNLNMDRVFRDLFFALAP